MTTSLQETIKKALWGFIVLAILLSVFILLSIFKGDAGGNYDTITVEGQAEVFAVPDIAEVNFTVRSENIDLSIAQKKVEDVINPVVAVLGDLEIEEKDIKTTFYNVYPRYEYGRAICAQYRCDGGERALVGYEASQSVSVTVRDLDKVSLVLSSLGSSGVSNISGPNFRIENEDSLKDEAREEAIQKAKEKAKTLAKSLGVRIIGIESFNEGYGGGIYYAKSEMAQVSMDLAGSENSFIPTLPQGENKIQASVSITYRVK